LDKPELEDKPLDEPAGPVDELRPEDKPMEKGAKKGGRGQKKMDVDKKRWTWTKKVGRGQKKDTLPT
jgi:hypothetical protein